SQSGKWGVLRSWNENNPCQSSNGRYLMTDDGSINDLQTLERVALPGRSATLKKVSTRPDFGQVSWYLTNDLRYMVCRPSSFTNTPPFRQTVVYDNAGQMRSFPDESIHEVASVNGNLLFLRDAPLDNA